MRDKLDNPCQTKVETTVSPQSDTSTIKYKFSEQEILRDLGEYVASTYSQHYVGKEEIQTIDVWESLNIASEMCQGTAIKYLMRLGRKEGINRKDLLKSMHYIILLTHFTDKERKQP